MSNETFVTIKGRLTAEPEIRFTPSGAAVANFTVAANARTFDRQSSEWKDKPATFWRCAAWNQGKQTLAENVAENLTKGTAVVVYGEVESRTYETKQGESRTVMELRVEAIGADLRWAHARQGQVAVADGSWTPDSGFGAPAPDPWAGPPVPGDDEPAF